MADYNLDEPDEVTTSRTAAEQNKPPRKKPMPTWNKWVLIIAGGGLLLSVFGWIMESSRIDTSVSNYKTHSNRLTERMKPEAVLMAKQLRTKAAQLARNPKEWKAKHELNAFITEAKGHIETCERSEGHTPIQAVFQIADRSLSVFKEVRLEGEFANASIADICDKFEDTADEMETELERVE